MKYFVKNNAKMILKKVYGTMGVTISRAAGYYL